MISVVICSINKKLAEQVKSNIDITIGIPWEPIIIENVNPSRPLTEVYNDGTARASFPLICFVHEDVSFVTQNWGRIVATQFDIDPGVGMIGVAGSGYKSKTLSGWMTSIPEFDRCNVLHVDKNGASRRLHYDQPPQRLFKEVVTLDGVFLCTRKSVATTNPFDQELLRGFHLYDLDISFRISRSYKIAVCFGIDIIHHTEGGDFGNKWVDETILWHKKYSDQLPAHQGNGNSSYDKHEYMIMLFWLKRLRTEKITFNRRIRWIRRSGALRHVSLWLHILLFFLFRPMRFVFRRFKN